MPKRTWCDEEDGGEQYPSKIRCLDDRQLKKMEERRLELLDQLPPENTTDYLDPSSSLIEEWLDLLQERDRLLREKIYKDNQKMVNSHLSKLHDLLGTIGHLDHSETPSSLKLALCHLHRELKSYDEKTGLLSSAASGEDSQSLDSVSTAIPNAPSIEALLATSSPEEDHASQNSTALIDSSSVESETSFTNGVDEPALSQNKNVKNVIQVKGNITEPSETEFSALPATIFCIHDDLPKPSRSRSRSRSTRVSKKSKSSTSRSRSGSSADLRKQLLSGKQNLKSTPGVKRSPGGTPERKSRPLMTENPNDLVTLALQRKFETVRQLYCSPTKCDSTSELEDSLNISID